MYRTKFTSTAFTSVTTEIPKSTLEDLRRLAPPKSVNLSRQPHLLLATYNGAVINKLNRNGDGITGPDILRLRDTFLHAPQNLEHKKDKIVGHVVNTGFSLYRSNRLVSEDTVATMGSPFNLVLSSVVYRDVHNTFANLLIDASDSESPHYNKVSTSWEISFDSYFLLLGSDSVADGELVTNPKHIEELSKHLKSNGGDGYCNGASIGRLIDSRGAYGSGFAFTANPAADVSGVLVQDFSDADRKTELASVKRRLDRLQQPTWADQMQAFQRSAS